MTKENRMIYGIPMKLAKQRGLNFFAHLRLRAVSLLRMAADRLEQQSNETSLVAVDAANGLPSIECDTLTSYNQPIDSKVCFHEAPGFFKSEMEEPRYETEVELLTLSKVITVLERQLADVNTDIERSVIGISQGFQGMARQAQAAVNAVGSVADNDEGGDGKISEMQTVINGLVKHMNESCESLGSASDRLREMESRLDGVETVLTGIEELAARSRLMALNGQIEAGRLGTAGAAFSVVASETKQLSQHAADTSSRAQGLLSELAVDITTTTKELRMQSETDATRLLHSKHEAETILTYIEENHLKTMKVLSDTGTISRELQSSITHAVMSLQFQDRVSQRMQHVIKSLKLIGARACDCADPQYDSIAEERATSILNELSASYTMDAERMALAGAVASPDASSDSFDVELF